MSTFKYCLNGSTLRPTPILDKIRIAGDVGFQAIELWHDDIDAYLKSGGSLATIRKALSDAGLEVPTTIYLKGWFETTGAEHQSELEECKRRMHQAAEVGAIHVIAGPPMGFADHSQGARNYYELLEIGRQIGVKPAMEFLGFVSDICTIEAALDVVTRANHPDGTVVLDPFHIQRGGGSVESVGLLKGSQVAICHFMDTMASPAREQQHDQHRTFPGDGVFDLKRLLALLKHIGYDRWLSLELFREDLWAKDPKEVAKEGLAKMKAVVEGYSCRGEK